MTGSVRLCATVVRLGHADRRKGALGLVGAERHALLQARFRTFLLHDSDYDSGLAIFELIKHGYALPLFTQTNTPRDNRTDIPTHTHGNAASGKSRCRLWSVRAQRGVCRSHGWGV
jgi:hypothetical protein